LGFRARQNTNTLALGFVAAALRWSRTNRLVSRNLSQRRHALYRRRSWVHSTNDGQDKSASTTWGRI